MLFIPRGLPGDYEIVSSVDDGDTIYTLYHNNKRVASEDNFMLGHGYALWVLRRVAWTRFKHGVTR